jgi:tetratricopeptide (TPR) repeat protein
LPQRDSRARVRLLSISKAIVRPLSACAQALLFVSISTFLSTTAFTGQTSTNSQEATANLAVRAEEAQRRGDYRTAAQMYQEMLKITPHSPELRADLGLMHHLLGQYGEAIRYFQEALRQNPQLLVPNLFMGLDLLQVGRARVALPYLAMAQKLNPHDSNALLGLGRAYTALGDLLKARAFYEQAVQMNSKNPRAWFGLGLTYMSLEDDGVERMGKIHLNSAYFQSLGAESFVQEGRFQDAVAKYRQLLQARSGPPCLRAEFGFALIQFGKLSDAREEFQTQLKEDPGCLMAILGAARLAIRDGNMATALNHISKVWQADPGFLSANAPVLWKGMSTEKIGTFESALIGASSPKDIQPGLRHALLANLTSWRREPVETFAEESTNFLTGPVKQAPNAKVQKITVARATQFYSEGRYTACRESLKRALSSLTVGGSLILAQCAYDSGDFRTSFQASQRAIDIDTQSPAAWFWLIKASQVLAVNALVQAGLTGLSSPAIHVMLGNVYRDAKKFDQAEAEYRKAIELEPRDVAAHLGLAATYYRELWLSRALPELKIVLQLAPQNPEASFMMADILALRREFVQAEPYAKAALHGDQSNLPLAHALLGRIYAYQGLTAQAIRELRQALPADHDGSFHYQIAMLYKRIGDAGAERKALKESESLRKNQENSTMETMRALR